MVPRVYPAIAAVIAELSVGGIAKLGRNGDSGYAYRSIDDVYKALAPLLAKHKLCMLPRLLERGQSEHRSVGGEPVFSVWVRAAFDLVSARDGSVHTIETFGEAMDGSDKATSKALTAAYKYAAMQAFCIPVAGDVDADSLTPRVTTLAPPQQGWEGWVADLQAIAVSCETHDALDRMQNGHRGLLHSLSLANPSLYAALGATIRLRRAGLSAQLVAA